MEMLVGERLFLKWSQTLVTEAAIPNKNANIGFHIQSVHKGELNTLKDITKRSIGWQVDACTHLSCRLSWSIEVLCVEICQST